MAIQKIINATIVNATGLEYNKTITIKDGIIENIYDTKDGEEGFDAKNKFVCPGLIDCHVHVTVVPGVRSIAGIFDNFQSALVIKATKVLEQMLLRGFTTVRDCGGADKGIAQCIDDNIIQGPRLFQCGKALSQTGGHADPRVPSADHITRGDVCCHNQPNVGRVVDGVTECLRSTRDELRRGADFIKIMAGGGVMSYTDPLDGLQFSDEEIRAICTAANNQGTYVAAHAYTPQAIQQAINCGVTSIEHGNMITEEIASLMAKKGVSLTPTLIVYKHMNEIGDLSDLIKQKNKRVLDSGLKALKIADDAGVNICYGSDLLSDTHAFQSKEFTIRSAILSAESILKSCTVNAAKLLRMEDKIGVIKKGAYADIIFVEKNPLEDITTLENVIHVIKNGKLIK
ncbi:hypothetical protein BJ944DRAFT_265878 [Cunninghamella echinulata]|nr:hypothetical protein BJ944DRAFT_265878 [Cunninghamella echinulata]